VTMRRALQDLLPARVCWRTRKSDLGPNFNHCLLKFEHQAIDKMIGRNDNLVGQYVDIESLQKSYRRYLVEGSAQDAMTIWKTLTLVQWLSGAVN
jgi:asparagine synthase (glutamine-hydrolysing)